MEKAIEWCVRFEVITGGYTPRWIKSKGATVGRDEVQEWAAAQVRENPDFLGVDDIYPTKQEGEGDE